MFIEAFQNVAPVKITVKELQEKLQVIFKIDMEKVRNVPGVENIFLYKIAPTAGTKKFTIMYVVGIGWSGVSIVNIRQC